MDNIELEKLNTIAARIILSADIDQKIEVLKCENGSAFILLKDGRSFKVLYTMELSSIIQDLIK
jgi:hypothetical protein